MQIYPNLFDDLLLYINVKERNYTNACIIFNVPKILLQNFITPPLRDQLDECFHISSFIFKSVTLIPLCIVSRRGHLRRPVGGRGQGWPHQDLPPDAEAVPSLPPPAGLPGTPGSHRLVHC